MFFLHLDVHRLNKEILLPFDSYAVGAAASLRMDALRFLRILTPA